VGGRGQSNFYSEGPILYFTALQNSLMYWHQATVNIQIKEGFSARQKNLFYADSFPSVQLLQKHCDSSQMWKR